MIASSGWQHFRINQRSTIHGSLSGHGNYSVGGEQPANREQLFTFSLLHPRGMAVQLDVRSAKLAI
jgi:hypothetical protein